MMHHLVPDFILQNFSRQKFGGQFPAVCLFVDTSGFTPLTQALMSQGTEGAEVIADALAAIFTPLVQIIYEQGGFVAGFAGDAFKVIFPLTAGEVGSDDDPYRRAVVSAWQISQHMAERPALATRFGNFDFSVKVTIGDGMVDWGIWYSEGQQVAQQAAAYFFEGAALDACLEADSLTHPGAVVMTDAFYQRLPAGEVTVTAAGPYWQLVDVPVALQQACPPRPIAAVAADEAAAAAFFPRSLLNLPIRGEFRQVVTVFINLQSLPAGNSLAPLLFQLLDRYGGYLCRIGRIGNQDRGGTLLLFWGVPQSTERDVARALHFLVELQAAVNTPLRAGVTSGLAYAGYIGSTRREEYTCHSNKVNLAARQMVAAPWGEVWLDETTARAAQAVFKVTGRGHHLFKGFADERSVFLLAGRRTVASHPLYAGRLVGREEEVRQLQQAVRPLSEGRFGGLVVISGEAGVGKSRLAHDFLAESLPLVQANVFLCQADEILRQSLNAFRYFLHHYFEQSAMDGESANQQRFNQRLDDLIANTADDELRRELDRGRSFLGALLNLHWPGSLYEQVEPKLRFENSLSALKALIKAESVRQPVIIHLEDAHWLDADSRTFLQNLTHNVAGYPFLVIATQRPPATEEAAVPSLVAPDAPQATIQLRPLPPAAIAHLAAARLEGAVSPELAALLVERAEGNPFFAEQILLYLQEQALIVRNGHGWQLKNGRQPNGTLPADVRSVLVARLDRLPAEVRQVVQAAAVLGREFAVQVLAGMLSNDGAVMTKVQQAARAAIWMALNDLRYLFQHVLLRDAAYEMQLQAQRRWLHQLAMEVMESLYLDLSPYYGELAYHAEQAGLVEKARDYWEKAGGAAWQAHQNDEAITCYSRALALTTATADRIRLLLAREPIYALQRAHAAQDADLAMLEQLAVTEGDLWLQAEVAVRRSRYANSVVDMEQALAAAQTAVTLARQVAGPAGVEAEAAGYLAWAEALRVSGTLTAISEKIEQSLRLAQAAGLRQVEAGCLYQLATNCYYRGELLAALAYGEQALPIYRQIGNYVGQATVLRAMGLCAIELKQYDRAKGYSEQALQIERMIGNRAGEAKILVNLGAMTFEQGEYCDCEIYQEQARRLFLELGIKQGEATTLLNLGEVNRVLGNFSQAKAYLEQALLIGREIDGHGIKCTALNFLGVVANLEENFDEARSYHLAALAYCQENGYRSFEGKVLTDLGNTLLGLGEWSEAAARFEQAMALRQELNEVHMTLESQAGLARAALAQGMAAEALLHVEPILDYLQTDTLTGTIDPVAIYLTCYRVLQAVHDGRAAGVLQAANDFLQKRAAGIADEATRRSFLENVPSNRQLVAEMARQ